MLFRSSLMLAQLSRCSKFYVNGCGDVRQKVTVITADIVASRKTDFSHESISERLSRANSDHRLLVPFMLSRGDELQGVVDGWLSCPEVIRRLRYSMWPIQIRVGLGLGYVEAIARNSWDMNGPPFYLAREAVDQAKLKKRPSTFVKSGDKDADAMINGIFALVDSILNSWSEGQWAAVHQYENLGTLALAGTQLGVSHQAVHKRLDSARWSDIRTAEAALAQADPLLTRLATVQG